MVGLPEYVALTQNELRLVLVSLRQGIAEERRMIQRSDECLRMQLHTARRHRAVVDSCEASIRDRNALIARLESDLK